MKADKEHKRLLDRIAELEATLRHERDLFKETFFTPADKRAEKAEAERDDLKARLEKLEEQVPEAAMYWKREYEAEYARRLAVEDLSRTTCDRYLTDIGPSEHVMCCDKESSRRVVRLVEERDTLRAKISKHEAS